MTRYVRPVECVWAMVAVLVRPAAPGRYQQGSIAGRGELVVVPPASPENLTPVAAGGAGSLGLKGYAVCRLDANCDYVVSWRDIDYFVAGMNNNGK